MPELLARNIQGSFFPPADAIVKREMLDVHAVHFILASTSDYPFKELIKKNKYTVAMLKGALASGRWIGL